MLIGGCEQRNMPLLELLQKKVSLQHQMFEENWDIFDNQSENTSDSE